MAEVLGRSIVERLQRMRMMHPSFEEYPLIKEICSLPPELREKAGKAALETLLEHGYILHASKLCEELRIEKPKKKFEKAANRLLRDKYKVLPREWGVIEGFRIAENRKKLIEVGDRAVKDRWIATAVEAYRAANALDRIHLKASELVKAKEVGWALDLYTAADMRAPRELFMPLVERLLKEGMASTVEKIYQVTGEEMPVDVAIKIGDNYLRSGYAEDAIKVWKPVADRLPPEHREVYKVLVRSQKV